MIQVRIDSLVTRISAVFPDLYSPKKLALLLKNEGYHLKSRFANDINFLYLKISDVGPPNPKLRESRETSVVLSSRIGLNRFPRL